MKPEPLAAAREARDRADEIEREAVIAALSKSPPLGEVAIAQSLGITRYRVREIRTSLGLQAAGKAGRPPKAPKPLSSAARTILADALAGVDSASSPEETERARILLEAAVRLVLEGGSAG